MRLKPTMALILLWALDKGTAVENGNVSVFNHQIGNKESAVELHSRRKRYIVFPKGSSLQLLLELLIHEPTKFHVVVGPTLQVSWPLQSEPIRSKRSHLSESSNLRGHMMHFRKFFNMSSAPIGENPIGNKYKIYSDFASLLDLFGMTVGLAWQLPDDPMIYSELKKKHKIYKRNVFKKMESFLRPGGANGRQCVLKALCESGQRTPSKKDFLREILHKIFSVDDEKESEENAEDKAYRKAHRSENQNCEKLYPECQFSVFSGIQ